MIVLEMLLTVVAVIAVVVLLIALLGRGLWRSLAERWKFEADVERRVSARFQSAEADREALKDQAREFVEKWFADKATLGEAQGAVTLTPMLRQVLERHHADEKVRNLAEKYRQATGKDLLPPELLDQLRTQAAEKPETAPATASALSPEEAAAIASAQKEVEAWLSAHGE